MWEASIAEHTNAGTLLPLTVGNAEEKWVPRKASWEM